MGAPAITWFCENGHLVSDVPHHYIMDDPEKCEACGSKNLRHVHSDYEGSFVVPATLLRVERKRKVVHIPVYDVSGLFARKEQSDA